MTTIDLAVAAGLAPGASAGGAANNGWVAVSAGSLHTCGLTSSGGVKCWGLNNYGQLGNGSTNTSNVPPPGSPLPPGDFLGVTTPGDVVGLTRGVKAIAAGTLSTCALTSVGGVKCWGHNAYGELGNGIKSDSNVPVDVVGLAVGVSAVSTGGFHACALTTSGSVKCWGDNFSGQLGNGLTSDSAIPVSVFGLTNAASVVSANGEFSCALTKRGAAKCWGDNLYGQLGNGRGGTWGTNSTTPVTVSGLSAGVKGISAGGLHACAVLSSGGVRCWGSNNFWQLGNGSTQQLSNTPVSVVGLGSGMAQVSAGGNHSCALTSGGAVKCWGYNTWGQLGNGTNVSSQIPVGLPAIPGGAAVVVAGLCTTSVLFSANAASQ